METTTISAEHAELAEKRRHDIDRGGYTIVDTAGSLEPENIYRRAPLRTKDGVIHVQPPVEILERMIAVRLHLDPCGRENGPLRVIPGSHQFGRLDAEGITSWRARGVEVTCEAPAGGLLLMRPLTLHASSKATVPHHRRVIHIEYAAESLPHGLEWFEQQI